MTPERWPTDDVDRGQPWQTQYAERVSRSINGGSPHVRRQLRLLAWFLGGSAIALAAFIAAPVAWGAVFG